MGRCKEATPQETGNTRGVVMVTRGVVMVTRGVVKVTRGVALVTRGVVTSCRHGNTLSTVTWCCHGDHVTWYGRGTCLKNARARSWYFCSLSLSRVGW